MNLHDILFASKISGKSTENADLSDYYTKSQTNSLIAGKVDKVAGKSLSTNDFTDEYKAKIDGTDKQITDKIAKIIANAPADFDTLKEISDWIESHEDSASAMNTAINNKVDKVTGKGLSTNDFTTTLKNKLNGLQNYDDTDIKADVVKSANQTAINKSTLGYQRKNLLKNTAVSKSQNGVTFTVNEDGTVTVNGTATIGTTLPIGQVVLEKGRNYALSGCPAGGSSLTYRIDARYYKNNTLTVIGSTIDTGEGTVVTLPDDADDEKLFIYIRIGDNTDVNSQIFRPMLRYAEITDNTYEPYRLSIEERLIALETAILSEKGE